MLRELGTPLSEVDPAGTDLPELTARQLTDPDRRIGELSRLRERVRTVEDPDAVRRPGVRRQDSEGGLWSFMQRLDRDGQADA